MIRQVLMVFVFTALAGTAHARCTGTDPYKSEPKEVKQRVEAQAKQHPFGSGLYWQVSKNGKTSTLMGTIHYNDRRTKRIPGAMRKRIAKADRVLIEVTTAEQTSFLTQMAQEPDVYFDLSGNGGIRAELTAEEWEKAKAILSRQNPDPEFMGSMRPWFFNMALMGVDCAPAALGPRSSLDAAVEQFATRRGIEVIGLERMQDILPIFRDSPKSEVLKSIKARLASDTTIDDSHEMMVGFYKRGEIYQAFEYGLIKSEEDMTKGEIRAARAWMMENMLARRHKNWWPTLTSALEQGNAFVAVGALHMGSKVGLLRLLQKDGYSIQRIVLR